MPLNVVWGVLLMLALGLVVSRYPLGALALVVVTAIPLAGLARLAGRATRGLDVNLSDGWEPIRTRPRAVMIAGAGFMVATVILTLNLLAGFALGNAVGGAFATAAGWGLVTAVSLGFAFWTLLTDPKRDTASGREIARLAALLVLAYPFRIGALAVILGDPRGQHRRVRRAGQRQRGLRDPGRRPLRAAGGGPPGGAIGRGRADGRAPHPDRRGRGLTRHTPIGRTPNDRPWRSGGRCRWGARRRPGRPE